WQAALRPSIACWAALLLAAGCARVQYQPRPLDAARSADAYSARTLEDTGLRDYLATHGAADPWPRASWDLAALSLAAVYWHPEVAVARARLAVAAAETDTSRTRLPYTLTARPEYNSKESAGETPWGLGVLVGLPIDLGDKRGARTAQLQRQQEAAELEVATAAWRVRSRLRRHYVDLYVAERTMQALVAEQEAREALLSMAERRERAGWSAPSDTAAVRTRAAEGEVSLGRARVRREQALAGVAEAAGVPLEALRGVRLEFAALDQPAAPPADPDLRRAALLNRIDLRRKLADYAVAEAALKLEVARQYPDITLVPGYFWDADEAIWSLAGLALVPPKARTRALVREAEARRAAEEQSFLALQAAVIAEAAGASARYRTAFESLAAARRQIDTARARHARVERQFDRGHADRVELVQSRLDALASERAAVVAMLETQQGLSALEDALQRPLDNPDLAAAPAAPTGAPAGLDPALNPALMDND
ncbi:MAG: TolC family protein, partial [Rubritepida sp.]|nr:TolC family protein [Rubritepida sp.]